MSYRLDCMFWGKECNSHTVEDCDGCSLFVEDACRNNGDCENCQYCD